MRLQLPFHHPSLLPSLLLFSSNYNNIFAWAVPNAVPKAAPVAEALPIPTALLEPEFQELDLRQTVYNNAPFSGAIYLVGSNGAQLSSASYAICPNQAPQGCGNIGVWNWCCPSGNTCAWANSDHSVVGCCPAGSQCSGSVDRSQIQTVYVTTTQYNTPQTTVVANNGNGGVFIAGNGQQTTTIVNVVGVQNTQTAVNYNGYCSTLYAHGPGLPATAQGQCGTILVLDATSDARRAVGWTIWGLFSAFYGALGIVGWFGFRRW